MIKREFKDTSGKKIANIYSFLDIAKNLSKDDIIKNILEEIPELESCGYAGYAEKDDLKNYALSESIFLSDKVIPNELNNSESIFEAIEEVLEKCSFILEHELDIFLFPNFDPFVKDKMFGNFGQTPWENTIHLYINFIDKEKISYTLAHEIAHSVSQYLHRLCLL
jgi:hypothetical protein